MHITLNPLFIKHPANRLLAKHVIYTEGKSPEMACEEILGQIH